jgi:hypothetical protein
MVTWFPWFFCGPLLVRSLSGSLSGCLSGLARQVLILIVIRDSYDGPALSGFSSDHSFGFQADQKPLNFRWRPFPFLRELVAGDAKLAALKHYGSAENVKGHRTPSCFGYQPAPCSEALAVPQNRMLKNLPVKDDEACHALRHRFRLNLGGSQESIQVAPAIKNAAADFQIFRATPLVPPPLEGGGWGAEMHGGLGFPQQWIVHFVPRLCCLGRGWGRLGELSRGMKSDYFFPLLSSFRR